MNKPLATVLDQASQGEISRRTFIRRTLAAGVSATVLGQFFKSAALAQETTLQLWHGWTGANNTTALNAVIDQYNSDNSDSINVVPTAFEWDALFSKWVVSVAAGQSPDNVIFHGSEVPEYASKSLVVPLEQYVADNNLSFDGVPEAVIANCQYDGQLYAVPGDVHPLGLYFNVDLVQEAGLDASKPPSTQEEFLAWAEALTKADGTQFGFELPGTGAIPRWLWFSLLHQFGGQFLDETGASAVNSEAGVQALQFMVDLIDTYKFAERSAGTLSGQDSFAAKRAAMRIIGPWEVNLRLEQGMNFNTAPVPVIGTQAAVWGNTHVLPIPKQRDEARYTPASRFIAWFYNNYAIPATTVGIIPVSPAAQASPEFTQTPQYPYYQAFVTELPYVVFEPALPQYTQIFSFAKPTPLSTNLEAALSGSKSVKQALDDMKAGIDELL
jgi:multiple sugar transport system substrate-binding protein